MSALLTLGETMVVITGTPTGPLRYATSATIGIAGAESNVAIGVRQLGLDSAWVGRLGEDELGELVLARLRGAGVDASGVVRDADAPTGLMLKEHRTAALSRVTYYRRGSAGSRLEPDDLDEAAIRSAGVLHVSGVTPALSDCALAAVEAAVDIATDAGTLVSFDVNFRSKLWSADAAAPVLRRLARRADVLFADADEARLVANADDAFAEALAALGPRHAVLKRGADGAQSIVDGAAYDQPAFSVPVADPVGAGDALVAGYLSGVLEALDAGACLLRGCQVAAFAVAVPGDWEGLPTLDELTTLSLAPGAVVR
jgi:2-dehydro-3-deoxygluconokinase